MKRKNKTKQKDKHNPQAIRGNGECPQNNSMMQKPRGMSYINPQHYAILMHFPAVTVSVTLREGWAQYKFMKRESNRTRA